MNNQLDLFKKANLKRTLVQFQGRKSKKLKLQSKNKLAKPWTIERKKANVKLLFGIRTSEFLRFAFIHFALGLFLKTESVT